MTGQCHKFPVIVGETGSHFETTVDVTWMYDLAEYMNNVGVSHHHATSLVAYLYTDTRSGIVALANAHSRIYHKKLTFTGDLEVSSNEKV